MKPPPPPPPLSRDLGISRGLDGALHGPKAYKVVEECRDDVEALSVSSRYDKGEISTGDATLPWYAKGGATSWEDWRLPSMGATWTEKAKAALAAALKSGSDEDLRVLTELGPSVLRVIAQTPLPDGSHKSFKNRATILAKFGGEHLQDLLMQDLFIDEPEIAKVARERLKCESRFPLVLLGERYLEAPNPQVAEVAEETIREALGLKSAVEVISQLKRCRHAGDFASAMKDASLPPWIRMLHLKRRLQGLDAQKPGKAFEKDLGELQTTLVSAEGRDPGFLVALELARFRCGVTEAASRLQAALVTADWGVRSFTAGCLAELGPLSAEPLIPLLLNLHRDRVRAVRLRANETAVQLYGVGPRMSLTPHLASDIISVRALEEWGNRRGLLRGEFGVAETVELKLRTGEAGPSGDIHPHLSGMFKGWNIRIIDHNDNGRFIDFGVDNLWIGENKARLQFLSRLVEIDGTWFGLEVDDERLKLTMKPYKGPLGTLSVVSDHKGVWDMPYVIFAMDRDTTLAIYNYDEGFKGRKVPAGIYKLYQSMVWIKRPQRMAFRAQVAPGNQKEFRVPPEGVVEARFGGELKAHIEARFAVPEDGSEKPRLLLQHLSVFGVSGEEYHGFSPQLNSLADVRQIDVRISRDEKGEDVVALWPWRMTGEPMIHDVLLTQENPYATFSSPERFAPQWRAMPEVQQIWLDVKVELPFSQSIRRQAMALPLERLSPQRWAAFLAQCGGG